MNRIFIADTHLGDTGKSDKYCWEDLLQDFLRRHKEDEVYLVGDIVDLIRCDFEKILWYRDNQLKLLEDKHYIPGNHDFVFSKYFALTWCEDGIYALHGHQFDIDGNKLWRTLTILAWVLGKFLGRSEDWFSARELFKMSPTRRFFWGSLKPYEDGAKEILKRSDVDVCVMGHLHKNIMKFYPDGIWVVVKDWCADEVPTYAFVSDEKVELRNVETDVIIKTITRVKKVKKEVE